MSSVLATSCSLLHLLSSSPTYLEIGEVDSSEEMEVLDLRVVKPERSNSEQPLDMSRPRSLVSAQRLILPLLSFGGSTPSSAATGFLPSSPVLSATLQEPTPSLSGHLPTSLEEQLLREGPEFPPKIYKGHPSTVFDRLRKNKEYLLFRNKELAPYINPSLVRSRKTFQDSNFSQGYNGDNDKLSESEEGQRAMSPGYLERRKKNNEAAKKSRDRRRQYEDELAVAAMFLEKEHMALKVERQYLLRRARSLENRYDRKRPHNFLVEHCPFNYDPIRRFPF